MKSSNRIIEGFRKGELLYIHGNNTLASTPSLFSRESSLIYKDVVVSYEVINQQSTTSGSSAILKSSLASFFLGTPGMMAGLGAKTNEIFWIAVEWANGEKSLLELDRELYNHFLRMMF